mmetsp:Transcript_26095/g.42793  ORF Transcript_26095/g.42793 Transcript_26095/m.42793 type:complete len:235 (-) Transcript_26095:112-816(-)
MYQQQQVEESDCLRPLPSPVHRSPSIANMTKAPSFFPGFAKKAARPKRAPAASGALGLADVAVRLVLQPPELAPEDRVVLDRGGGPAQQHLRHCVLCRGELEEVIQGLLHLLHLLQLLLGVPRRTCLGEFQQVALHEQRLRLGLLLVLLGQLQALRQLGHVRLQGLKVLLGVVGDDGGVVPAAAQLPGLQLADHVRHGRAVARQRLHRQLLLALVLPKAKKGVGRSTGGEDSCS